MKERLIESTKVEPFTVTVEILISPKTYIRPRDWAEVDALTRRLEGKSW